MFDRRIAKSVDADGNGTFDSGETYVYDGSDIALVFDETDDLVERLLHGPGVDQPLASEDASGDVLWLLADNQGTIRDAAEYDDVSGDTSVVNHITYGAFGNITAQTGSAYEPRHTYTGREWDADAELFYYRARWYDPQVGRFISEDPIGFAAGDANLSRYVDNAPTNYVDPSGLGKTGSIFKFIFKQGDTVIKTSYKSYDEALNATRARVKDALKPTNQRKYSQDTKLFILTDEKTAKRLAEEASPLEMAVKHDKNDAGYPAHYHPVKRLKNNCKPDTSDTPHIGPDYTGTAQNHSVALLAISLSTLNEGGQLLFELSPVGDVNDVAKLTGLHPNTLGDMTNELFRAGTLNKNLRARQLELILGEPLGNPYDDKIVPNPNMQRIK